MNNNNSWDAIVPVQETEAAEESKTPVEEATGEEAAEEVPATVVPEAPAEQETAADETVTEESIPGVGSQHHRCFKVADETLGQIETFLTDSSLPPELRQDIEIRREELLTAQNGLLTAKTRLRDLCEAANQVITRYHLRVIEKELEKAQSLVNSLAEQLRLGTEEVNGLQQRWDTLHQKLLGFGAR